MLRVHVAAPFSGLGKTLLICRLLPFLPGWGTIKVSIDREGRHRHGRPRLLEVAASSDRAGSDTARHRAAGSVRTLWVRATPSTLAADLRRALDRTRELPGVLVEGNSAWNERPGDRLVLVTAPATGAWKSSARRLANRVDLVVVHDPRGETAEVTVVPYVPPDIPRIHTDLSRFDDSRARAVVDAVLTWTRP